MKPAMIGALLFSSLAFGLGAATAPASPAAAEGAPAGPAVTLDADELQGGSCGDHQCQPPEDCNSCPQDCGDCCGDHQCQPPEDCNSCPQDCPCG